MRIFKLIFKNALRHKLRTILTMLGIAVALLAFGLIRTVISAWYAGVEASAQNRLVTRSAVSLIQPLPLAYREQLAKVPGVRSVGYANWFGAYYGDPNNFFANFAVDEAYLEMYPEFVVPPDQKAAYLKERNACIVGRKLVERFGWKLDQSVTLTGTIYYGEWEFVIRGIYSGAQPTTDETAFLFHWDYLNERTRERAPEQADNVGWYMLLIDNQANPAVISEAVDAMYKNSYAETKTETERAFQQSFVSMSGAILLAMESISGVVIFIVLLVLANTMAMTARERLAEYAVLKTLGFRPFHLIGLIGGESMFIAMGGFVIGLALMIYVCNGFATFITSNLGNFFPVFELKNITVILAFISALFVGLFAAAFPAWRAVQMRIADGLHRVA
ncbi:MAG: hypothetical protein ILNGONEN_02059 [Syntrophorhabdaceae bacterium]|nr:hypothetical protein [Syntrophorhabdaceae bacterium]